MELITCSECGTGYYYAGRDTTTGQALWAVCDDCGHELAPRDLSLEAGEVTVWDAEGRLSYVTLEG